MLYTVWSLYCGLYARIIARNIALKIDEICLPLNKLRFFFLTLPINRNQNTKVYDEEPVGGIKRAHT